MLTCDNKNFEPPAAQLNLEFLTRVPATGLYEFVFQNMYINKISEMILVFLAIMRYFWESAPSWLSHGIFPSYIDEMRKLCDSI